tara:strand:+ start:157 stop:864 length:708 start_codon:yes stop_codon:yes gene_type:complete
MKVEKLFLAPKTHRSINITSPGFGIAPFPNGLQCSKEGFWIVDQCTDEVFLVDFSGNILKQFVTESGNSSGITIGDNIIWISNNGGPRDRISRSSDHIGVWLLGVNDSTGKTVYSYKYNEELGFGFHGLEYKNKCIWIAIPAEQSILQVQLTPFKILHRFSVKYERVHGIALDRNYIWACHVIDRVIVQYDIKTGDALEEIFIPKSDPEPHGLSIWEGYLYYCDAVSGWICKIEK